ncbi:hypothetical protein QO206_03290 [Leeuwenhoekiella aequorea]|uniref:hypothetical protein n=1 Tax=Leeuwenhoekiella aequorea TaxID=283736 RepID=UPI00352E8C06|tara:strand:+ start:11145 stop:11381 length:237 start_codon:yes stop_codon:yes gene_type:complete
MSTEKSNQESKSKEFYTECITAPKILMPLQMQWRPKEDITTYELALCMSYLVRYNAVMPYEVDLNDKHLRHFKITDHN